MPAYVIVDSRHNDEEAIKPYGAAVGATVQAHGGKRVIASTDIEVIEGDWAPPRLVVLEFADMVTAKAWYNSPEYQAIAPIRIDNSDDRMIFVDQP